MHIHKSNFVIRNTEWIKYVERMRRRPKNMWDNHVKNNVESVGLKGIDKENLRQKYKNLSQKNYLEI